jgi:hypothetical protein
MAANSMEEYRGFISQIEIKDIKVLKASLDNTAWPGAFPGEGTIDVKRDDPEYRNQDAAFICVDGYSLVGSGRKDAEPIMKVSVKFAVTYSSKIPMEDKFFKQFKESNLSVNTWPYLREFVHNSLSRMGLPTLILPAKKLGMKPVKRASASANTVKQME